jgi:hypothetical protein
MHAKDICKTLLVIEVLPGRFVVRPLFIGLPSSPRVARTGYAHKLGLFA